MDIWVIQFYEDGAIMLDNMLFIEPEIVCACASPRVAIEKMKQLARDRQAKLYKHHIIAEINDTHADSLQIVIVGDDFYKAELTHLILS